MGGVRGWNPPRQGLGDPAHRRLPQPVLICFAARLGTSPPCLQAGALFAVWIAMAWSTQSGSKSKSSITG